MENKSEIVDWQSNVSQSSEFSTEGQGCLLHWNLMSRVTKINMAAAFIYYSRWVKQMLRRLWTLLVTGRQITNLSCLTQQEGYDYINWLWGHLAERQNNQTGDSFKDYTFCYFIYNELRTYEDVVLGLSQNERDLTLVLYEEYELNLIYEPMTFDEQYYVQSEDKTTFVNQWVHTVSKVAELVYIEGQRILQEQRRIEEEKRAELEESRRSADLKKTEERREIELQSALAEVHLTDETDYSDVDEESDMHPCACYLVKSKNKYSIFDLPRPVYMSTPSSDDGESVTDYEKPLADEPEGVLPSSAVQGKSKKRCRKGKQQFEEKGTLFGGPDMSQFDYTPRNGWYFNSGEGHRK